MDAVTSVTAAKMRALREAKKLGCAGAHKTEDGKWHPCSSAERLAHLRPGSKPQSSSFVLPSRSLRTQRGANNLQRQWENLEESGIVAIDTLTGGGLVSGVIAKSYQPAAPRDEDPDVFTDIEAARDRSRQLGCIGVSRRVSRSGRTIWMPCTNMSDLANRTGRTFLGRRNMQKRTERFIMDAVRKAKPKAERRRKKSLHADLHGISVKVSGDDLIEVKRLGPKVGQQIGRGLRSAPNGFVFVDVTGAIDADKDGIVFEGKPIERPIIPRFIVPEGVGRRISRAFEGTAIANEENRRRYGASGIGEIDPNTFASIAGFVPESLPRQVPREADDVETLRSMRSIFGRRRNEKLATSKRKERVEDSATETDSLGAATAEDITTSSRRKARKEVSGILRNIDEVTDEYEFYSIADFQELLDVMIPTSNEGLEQALRTNPFTRNFARRLVKRIADADPNYEAASVVKEMLKQELIDNPAFMEGLRRYGMPPIVVTDYQPDIEGMGLLGISGGGPESWNLVMGGYASSGFIAFNTEAIPDPSNIRRPDIPRGIEFRNIDVDQMLRHELAHGWEVMAAKQNPRSLEHYVSSLAEMHENLKRGIKNSTEFEGGAFEPEYRQIYWGTKQERESARKISPYAETARVEWFAESFAAYTDSDISVRMTVDNLSIQNMADVLGLSVNEFVTSFGPKRSRTSLRSSRSSKHLNTIFGEQSLLQKEAVDWFEEHPDYIDDAPSALLVRMSPDVIDNSINVSLRSMRSAASSAANARVSNDPETKLGQSILDNVFERAQSPNRDPKQPTMWFLGGTTGSGKSQMRQSGLFIGVPTADEIPDIDPDEIKKGHPRWNGGRGALEIHGWSTRWTRYGRRQAMEQQRDHVVTGTGVRTEQLSEAKRSGFKTIGHFVYTPVNVAERRMKARAKSGGPDLPLYKAQGYSDDLRRTTTDAILRGDIDEFYLYDNGIDGANARLVAQRTADGSYLITDRAVFEAFLGRENARRVEAFWDQTRKRIMGDNNASTTARSMRGQKSTPATESFRNTLVRAKDIDGKNMRHSELVRTQLDFKIDLGSYDWSHSSWVGVDLKGNHTFREPFNGQFMLLREGKWNGVQVSQGTSFAGARFELMEFNGVDFRDSDMSGAEFWGAVFGQETNLENVRFDNAVFARASFYGSDLRNSGITIDQIRNSGIEWTDDTRFPPEVQQYIDSMVEGTDKIKDPTTGLNSFVNPRAETTTPIIRAAFSDIKAMLRSRPKRRPSLDGVREATSPLRGIELSRTSLIQEDADALQGKSLVSGFARFASFVGTKLRGTKFVQMDADGADFSDTDIFETSFTSSFLRRAKFIKAKIRSELSFRNSDLTDSDFTDAEFIGGKASVNFKGARLMGANLGKMPLRRIQWDGETEWNGAKWEIDVLPQELRNKGIVQIGMRSMRGGSLADARETLSTFNDTLINWSSLSKSDKTKFVDDFYGSYRELLESRQNALSANSMLRDSNEKTKKLEEQLQKLTDQLGASGNAIIGFARSGDSRSFIDAYRSAKRDNPDILRGKTPRSLMNDINALLIDMQSGRTDNEVIRQYRDNERGKSQLLESMRSLLDGDLFESSALKKPSGSLPRGARSTEPLIPNSQILRSQRNIMDVSDEEVRSIAEQTGQVPDFLDKDSPQERLVKTLQEARDEVRNTAQASLPSAPGISDSEARQMRNSIQIKIAPNGIPMLVAQPYQAIVDEIPDKRDWSNVLAPSLDDARRLAKAITEARKAIGETPPLSTITPDDVDKATKSIYGRDVFQKIIDKIVNQLGEVDVDDTSGDVGSFAYMYLLGIRQPRRMQALEGTDGYHDFFGHFGIGRGFDRHGEWAAFLVTDSIIRDHPEFDFLTPQQKEIARRDFMLRGVFGLSRIQDNAALEFEQRFKRPFGQRPLTRYDEEQNLRDEIAEVFSIIHEEIESGIRNSGRKSALTLDQILDALGVPPSTSRTDVRTDTPTSRSMRSSRAGIPLSEASDDMLDSLAKDEHLIRSQRAGTTTLRSRRAMTDDERARFEPLNLEPDQKIKLQPGTTLVYANEYDEIIRTELIGPQVARLRGTPGLKLYIDPTPDNQAEVNHTMQRWEKEFGPIGSPSRQASGRRSQPNREERSRNQQQQRQVEEDPVERILREAEEARTRRTTRSQRRATSNETVIPIEVDSASRPIIATSTTPPMPRTRQSTTRPQLSSLVPQIRTSIGADGRLQIDPRDKKRLVLNQSSIIDNLKLSDIPENYQLTRRIEQRILDDIKEFETDNVRTLTEDERRRMTNDMRLKLFKQDVRMAIMRDQLFPNDDGTLSAELFRDGEPSTLFGQSSIVDLAEGKSIFVTNIPATDCSTPTKNAIVSRINGILVMTELTDRMAERLKKHISTKNTRDSASGAVVSTFEELLDVSHLPGGEAYSQLDETRDAISRLGETIMETRADIPKPHVILKQDYALYPPNSGMEQKDVAGLAYLQQGVISFFGTARHHIGFLPLIHEWGHHIQGQLRRRGKYDKVDDGDWRMAMFLDKTAVAVADIPKGDFITAPVPGGPVTTSLKNTHVPKINSASVTDYGKTNEDEDWAESVALFLADKRVGWLLHESDSSGKPLEGGKKLTFAQLYPQRAQILERVLYGKEATTPQVLLNQPENSSTPVRSMRSQSTPSYDKRFKDKYGARVPDGDGDCFVVASDMLSTLRKEPYNFTSEQIRLVHGTPLGTGGEAEGIRFPHAWVEVNTNGWKQHDELRQQADELRNAIEQTVDEQEQNRLTQQLMRLESQLTMQDITIFDYSNGNEFRGPRVLYYAIGNIREQDSRYYSPDEADEQMMENEHYGPWE